MLIDLERTDEFAAARLDADVCIVGAGAAGLTLTKRLASPGRHVLLVEAGGRDYEPSIAKLGAGENVGFPYWDLEDSRLRFFGGTTAVWGGRCAELDEIDFERRDWVPHSGWPFTKHELASYYAAAREIVEIEQRALGARLGRVLGVEPTVLEGGVLEPVFWQFDDRWDRFGISAHRELVEHPGVTVLLHATVTRLALAENGEAIAAAEVRTLRGRRATLRARVFVLAAGGLDNPRLLLASRDRAPQGIGNDHDLVGRFFMEHPHARGGRLFLRRPWPVLSAFRQSHFLAGGRYAATLRPSDAAQREHRILNASFTPKVRLHPGSSENLAKRVYDHVHLRVNPTRGGRALWRLTKGSARWLQTQTDPILPWLRLAFGTAGLYLSVRAEQAPNPASRVFLQDECDALGMPKLALDWRFSALDKRTLRVVATQLGAELESAGAGRVEVEPWLEDDAVPWATDPLIGNHSIGGYHHMGTTRMASDRRAGVVDATCRVHGVENLYVAGSSVFPTSGWANPTLTILALALRLGDYLETKEMTSSAAQLRSAPADAAV
jgi:choline dehydrogenase-like flavoprotein